MGLVNNFKNIVGVLNIQIEGFFTERFINLCKINNIKIWNIRNIVKGVVRFEISITDFKKLRKVAKKTKCKVVIKDKKGLYFTLFKYRKRKILFLLLILAFVTAIVLSTFIWTIEIEGNENLKEKDIYKALQESGLYIGKNKNFLDKKEVTNLLRLNTSEISWAGIDINGTKATVKIVEKTRLLDKNVQNTEIGDIVATKSGIISKIVAENGTAKFKQGSYINKGDVAIEGTIYSKYMEPSKVSAKGILKIQSEYCYEKYYSYVNIKKEYTNKKLYTIGVTINSNENMLNYLNKDKKYDITKSSKKINIFGNEISFNFYTCLEYIENEITYTKDELINISNKDVEEYLNANILTNCNMPNVVDIAKDISDVQGGIKVKTIYTLNEEIGKFVKTEGE